MPAMMKNKTLVILPMMVLASCTAHHMATADRAYERMAYAKATCGYEKALQHSNDRNAALRAADAYHRQNKLEKAADWFAYAESISSLAPQHAMQYGQVLLGLDRVELATEKLRSASNAMPGDPIAASLLKASEERSQLYTDSSLFSVKRIDLHGIEGAFSPMVLGNSIVFAGERSIAAGNTNPWNGLSFLDLYITRDHNGTWTTPERLPGEINGRFHEGPAVFSTDGNTMYFTRSDYFKFRLNKDENSVSHLKLFRSEKSATGEWGNIHQFAYNGDHFSTGHAALSSDGNTLYFISDRPGGLGGTDIYRCTRSDSTWNEPENLGATINTPGNEMFPTMSGDTLYFSTNGRVGLGGADIFRSHVHNGEWSTPQNMHYPINSPADDLGLVFNRDLRTGYFSSDRSGRDALYSFTMNEPTLIAQGICIDMGSDEPIADVSVRLLDMINGVSLTTITGEDGKFEFRVRPDRELQIRASKDEMLTETIDLITDGQRSDKTYTIEMEMKPIELDKPILVNNIYYDYDKWEIRPEAAVELRKLGRLFINNPDITFELSSHTDSRASELYNLVLSEARAKSAVDFLIRQGVDPRKIVAKGYGESQLMNTCSDNVECTEEQHQQNRRTEFKIIKSEIVQK